MQPRSTRCGELPAAAHPAAIAKTPPTTANSTARLTRSRSTARGVYDPACVSAPTAPIPLLGYRELYERWERQQWAVGDLDFTQDRADWHERFDSDRRRAERYGLSGFFLGEQRVAQELGPMLRAAPTEEARIFLATRIA